MLPDGTSTWTDISWYDVPNAWSAIEIHYQAFANSGSLTLWLDDVQKQSLTFIDNDTRTLTEVRLGAQGVDANTNGTLYFDDFESRRFSYIGTLTDPGVDDPQATNQAGWFARTYAYSATIPHAVTSVNPETGSADTYTYDANGNMTCRVEGGVTFKQDYNAENRISAIHKMNGNCSTGTVTESWLYGYDGDGVRVSTAHYTGVTQDSLTLYYMGGAYEVTGSAVKKYYSMAGQTIMRDSDGSLKYLLTDHLGSTSAVVDGNGTLLSQQMYLPFGEVRTIPNSPVTQTDFGYTGQRNLSGTGLMDYRARMYSPQLGRFIQPDSIVPYPAFSQSWNRFSYVMNNPINFIDPTGHQNCGPDLIYCGGLPENDYYSQPRPTLNKSSGSLDKPGCGVDGKGAYGFHCTVEDLDGATMKQRLDWFRWLTENMDENIRVGTSDWFNNIDTVVSSFVWSGQDDNDWLLTVDANILVAVQDGYVAYLGFGGAMAGGSGADKWREFFVALGGQETDEDQLIALWGAAEQRSTDEGLTMAAASGFGGGTWWRLNWITTDYGRDDIFFTTIGNRYRGAGNSICGTLFSTCVGGFFDPRTTWGPISPVGYAAYPTYFIDYLGYSVTGH